MLTAQACNGGLPQSVSVVSSIKGEGVTYTALALATTLAIDTTASVCLVELNWWSPGLHKLVSQGANPAQNNARRLGGKASAFVSPAAPAITQAGLADVLTGSAAIDDVLIRTELPNLSLIAAGAIPVERRPVIARSGELKEQLDELRQRFDYLILDVPAILATSDSMALAALSSACCIVVRQGVTPANSVKRALDDIKHLNILGVMLNQTTLKTPRWMLNLIPQE